VACDSADGLRELARPGINLVHWPRRLEPALAEPLARAVAPKDERDAQTSVERGRAQQGALRLLEAAPWLADDLRAPLRDDLVALFDAFAHAAEADVFSARLEWILGEKCPKLHVDHHRARLVTAYVGPGTCWVANKDARRNMLGAASARLADPNAAILPDPNALRSAAQGEVVLMKGNAWPGEHGMGAIHRSPHVDGPRFARLMLVLTAHAHGA
jgi:hypothetical protein